MRKEHTQAHLAIPSLGKQKVITLKENILCKEFLVRF